MKAKGVFGRLASHASGRRSGDQFNIYICDRFVVPELSSDKMRALASGTPLLDKLTRNFIHEHLTYRVVVTGNGASALPSRRTSAVKDYRTSDVRRSTPRPRRSIGSVAHTQGYGADSSGPGSVPVEMMALSRRTAPGLNSWIVCLPD